MEDAVENVCESVKVKRTFKKKWSVYKHQRPQKNSIRRFRKNRSKIRYYKSLKNLRHNRKADDLCAAINVFDITDMEWAPSSSSTALPIEVTEWQKQDQIAYWKSRAISLEMENRMLHQHLRDVYAKTIEEYSQSEHFPTTTAESSQNRKEILQNPEKRSRKKAGILLNTTPPVNPKEPTEKNRLEEMKKIYGESAQKIMGMETAIQLNFEKQVNKLNPSYWPNMPLRLKFD